MFGNEELVRLFEANNLFDMLAIQTYQKDCEKTVGRLQREISHPTKYLINRGAKIIAKLSSIHCEPKNETITGSFTENINLNLDIQPKKKKKKETRKIVQKPKRNKYIQSFFQKR